MTTGAMGRKYYKFFGIGIVLLSLSLILLNPSQNSFASFEPNILEPNSIVADDWDEDPNGIDKILALTDGNMTTFVSSDANNEFQMFKYDTSSISGIAVHNVTLKLIADTDELNKGAVKLNYAISNETHTNEPESIFLNKVTVPTEYEYTTATNPHTNLPFTFDELSTLAFGFAMQTDAKPSNVYEFTVIASIEVDTEPPTINFESNNEFLIVEGNTHHGAINVDLGTVTATDNYDPSPTLDNDAPEFFPLGETLVNYTATDNAGNVATATQSVTIEDTTPPVLTLPVNVTREATAIDTPIEEILPPNATAIDDVDPSPSVTSNAPTVLPIGTTIIEWTATDYEGNSVSGNQEVVIQDTTPPTFTFVPADATITAAGVYNPYHLEDATATDALSTPVITNNAPLPCDSSGDPCFEAGTNIVTWTATDGYGNSATANQTITVTPTALEAGWIRTVGINTQILNNTTTQIGTGESLYVKDYRGNTNITSRDTIQVTINSDSDNSGVTLTLIEDDVNSAEFTHPVKVTFFNGTTIDDDFVPLDQIVDVDDYENDFLKVVDEDTGIATRGSDVIISVNTGENTPLRSEIDNTLSDSISVHTVIDNVNSRGAPANNDEPVKFDEFVYIIEASGEITAFDGSYAGGGLTTLSGTSGLEVGQVGDEAGAVFVSLKETAADDGTFVSSQKVKFSDGLRDGAGKVVHVALTNGEAEVYAKWLLNDQTANAFVVDNPDAVNLVDIGVDTDEKLTCAADVDQDALCDEWETEDGLLITLGNGATYFLPCTPGNTIADDPSGETVCATPDRKDIFVEIDYMQFQKPDSRAIEDVVEAFDRAKVTNLNGANTGIALHVFVNDGWDIQFDEFWTWTEFHDNKDAIFGTSSERAGTCTGCSGSAADILTAKRNAFHYGQFVHQQLENPGSSGIGEVGANDFYVSLGDFSGGTGTRSEQAATLMHELGHNLDLEHGGPGIYSDEINCKPNYLSVMNYIYQFDHFSKDRPLDFSRTAGVQIDTTALYEENGFGTIWYPLFSEGTVHWTTTNTQLSMTFADPNGEAFTTPTWKNVDWNADGDFDTVGAPYDLDITNIGAAGCTSTTGILTSYEDWSSIKFDFKENGLFASGGIGDQEEADRATLSFLLAQELNPLRKEIRALPDSQCKTDLLEQEQQIRDIFTGLGSESNPRKNQIEASVTEIEDLLTLLDTTECELLTASSTQASFIALSNEVVEIEYRSGEVAISSNGVADVLILGSPDFDTENINATSVRLHPECVEGQQCVEGAEITHEFSSENFKNSHYKDDNGDGYIDLFLHFRQNEIGFGQGDTDTIQRICLSGFNLDQPKASPFEGCDDDIPIVKGSGKGKGGGPNN
jgi:hypothetical protein